MLENVRLANERADEPHEIEALVKDCVDGSADENITQKWLDTIEAAVNSGQELLAAVGGVKGG